MDAVAFESANCAKGQSVDNQGSLVQQVAESCPFSTCVQGSALHVQGGSAALSEAASDKAWSLPLGAAILGTRQLGLNGWDHKECIALENELGAWQQEGNLSNPTHALR